MESKERKKARPEGPGGAEERDEIGGTGPEQGRAGAGEPRLKSREDGRSRRGRENRSALLAAARALFLEQGYRPATVDGITRRAGLAHGTFYRHFQGKDEILIHLLDDLNASFTATIDMGGPPASPAEVRPLTRVQIERFFRLALEWQGILRIYREARQESPAANAHWEQILGYIMERVLRDITRSERLGWTRGLDGKAVAAHLVYGVEQIFWRLVLGEERPERVEEIAAAIADLYYWGLYREGQGDS